MPATETLRDEMHRLAAYLRQNPSALALSPDEIAASSGISPAAVRSVIAERAPERKEQRQGAPRKIYNVDLSNFLDRLFAQPLLFVIVTYAIAGALLHFAPESPQTEVRGTSFHLTLQDAIQMVGILVTMSLHMLCFYWRARARIAIYGSLLAGGLTIALSVFSILRTDSVRVSGAIWLTIFGLAFMTCLYAFVGVGFASLGGFVRFRKEESRLRKRSRQELLERLFEIEEALRLPEVPTVGRRFPWLEPLRKNVFILAPLLAFAVTIIMSLTALLPGKPATDDPSSSVGFIALRVVLEAITIGLQIGCAYLAGSPWRGVLVSLAYGYTAALVALIPIGDQAFRGVGEHWLAAFAVGSILAIVLGLFAGLGASVEERAYQARRRQANDPAVLLTEFVQIQRQLNPTAQSKCVMVVDAAKSSMMKANADPLVAEWSFRAYQEFIADIVRDCGGTIHSTAGDGAMAAFDDAACAVKAAKTIQTKIADFNAFVSRLKDPFRLRIGIHCGDVSGELDEVEFTAVLDIAAHVEAASQVGGIAVTAPVAEQLPNERFAEIQQTVDEFRVFLALNPTLDPGT